jgi:flagellar biosynthesis/type III secretory pathway M-ring protein FliF/YscJ
LRPGWAAVMILFGLIAFAASLYLVVVLEILKFRRYRERQLRKQEELSQEEIDEEIEREVETGEFEAVDDPAEQAEAPDEEESPEEPPGPEPMHGGSEARR